MRARSTTVSHFPPKPTIPTNCERNTQYMAEDDEDNNDDQEEEDGDDNTSVTHR